MMKMINRMSLLSLFSLLCLWGLVACDRSGIKMPKHSNIHVFGDSVLYNGVNNDSANLIVMINDGISFTTCIEPNQKTSVLSLLRANKESYNDIALLLVENNGKIDINLKPVVGVDTTFSYNIEIKDVKQYSSEVLQGPCASLTGKFEVANMEKDIISWLYRKNMRNVSEETIEKMRLYIKELNGTDYKEYVTKREIPVLASFDDLEYVVSSDLVADNYYLLACKKDEDIEVFVEEMVSRKFKGAMDSLNRPMYCYSFASSNGVLCLMLVGIDNDWNYQIAPIGLVCVDNIEPTFFGISSLRIYNDNDQPSFLYHKHQIRISSETKAPRIHGNVEVDFGAFEGRGYMLDVPFTFEYKGDVKTLIVHRTKTTAETIDLTGKTSPYHITLSIGLNTGDNYIPIDAIDACGNKATYDLLIATKRIDRNPQIENNIYN